MTKIAKMFDFLFNSLYSLYSYLSQLLFEYCPGNDSSYYGSLLIFTSVSFGMVSAFISLTHSNYPKLVKDNKENIKSGNDVGRKFSLEKLAVIECYSSKNTGIFLFIAFLFLLGGFFDIFYMIFNWLTFGKFSFIVILVALIILLSVVFWMGLLIIKTIYIREIRLKLFKALKNVIDWAKPKVDKQIDKHGQNTK